MLGALISLGFPSMFALGVSFKHKRSSLMLKVLSWVVLLIELILNGVFSFLDFSIQAYVIINGLMLLLFVLIYNSIYRAKM